MIDLETGEVELYKCRLCERAGKTLFEEQLFYANLSRVFNHLIKSHNLKMPEIKAGTPKLWTHYLKHIKYTLKGEDLENLRKLKKSRERLKKTIKIVKNGLETVLPNEAKKKEIGFPPSLRFSHNGTPDSND